jgi:hypothetical protein
MPGAAWTSPPDRSHSQVSRTESPDGQGHSPAAFAEVPDTAQKPAVSGTSGIHSGSVAAGVPASAGPAAARAYGLLAALTADAYAAMSSH